MRVNPYGPFSCSAITSSVSSLVAQQSPAGRILFKVGHDLVGTKLLPGQVSYCARAYPRPPLGTAGYPTSPSSGTTLEWIH
jgi:hypothetical protein